MDEVRTVLIAPAEHFSNHTAHLRRTVRITYETMQRTERCARIVRGDDLLNACGRQPPPREPPESLPRSHDIRDSPEEVGMAPLEHPPTLRCDDFHPSETIAHPRGNPTMHGGRNPLDHFPPPLLALVPGFEDRSQEDRTITMDGTERAEVCDPPFLLHHEPETIAHEDEASAWDVCGPRLPESGIECAALPFLHRRDAPSPESRNLRERELVAERPREHRGAPRSSLWTTTTRSDSPRHPACNAAASATSEALRATVRTVPFTVLVHHTR